MNLFTDHLRSSARWLKASHLRLLVSGLVAIGLIASVSLFAASSKSRDSITVIPGSGTNVSSNFAITTSFKPRNGRQKFNVQVYLDGQLVDSRSYGKKTSGKKQFIYVFQNGVPDNRALFDAALLQPGTHQIRADAFEGNKPGQGKLIKRDKHAFTLTDAKNLRGYQEGSLTVVDGESLQKSPITDRRDSRIGGHGTLTPFPSVSPSPTAQPGAWVTVVRAQGTASNSTVESTIEVIESDASAVEPGTSTADIDAALDRDDAVEDQIDPQDEARPGSAGSINADREINLSQIFEQVLARTKR
jgi:hypothetical protein